MYITFLSYYPYSKFPIKQVRKSEEQSLPRESKYQVSKFSSKSLRKSLSKLEGNRRNQSAKKDHPEEAKQTGRTSPTKQLHQNKSPNKEGSLQGSNSLTKQVPKKPTPR